MSAELQEKVQKLQSIEESLHGYLGQKQQVQAQLLELETAHEALAEAKSAYRVIGNIMVEQQASAVKKDLDARIERAKLRIAAIEKQESKLKKESESLQAEIMKGMK